VRVLLSDLAERLGTIGHLSALRRESSGSHVVEDALTLDELAARVAQDAQVLLAPTAFVTELDSVVVTPQDEDRLRKGQRVTLEERRGEEIAALNEAGSLVGVLRRRAETWQPVVILPVDGPRERG
jgi:tRNA pseudouridine55 synthase